MRKPTPTHRRILKLLSDGKPHLREDVRDCLEDYLSGINVLNVHLAQIRKRYLHPRGETILCVLLNRKIHYQHVILLPGVKSPPDVWLAGATSS